MQLIMRVTDLGRVKSIATIPSISTHLQQGEESRKMAHIPPDLSASRSARDTQTISSVI